MDAAFYFSFYEKDNEPTVRHLGFCIGNVTWPWSEIAEDVYECEDHLERTYGPLHSWITGPSHGVNLFGYELYELNAHHHDELIEQLRKVFLRISPSCVVSEVLALDINTRTANPSEIFQHTKNMYEQQQAEQARATLKAHIHTRAPPAAAKKM